MALVVVALRPTSSTRAVDGKTVASYLDLLVDLLLVRRLSPWHGNVRKRLVKSPKVYVRDSGLVHALLGIGDREMLLSHPVVGATWEGLAIEIKRGLAPKIERGFHLACDTIRPERRLVVYGGGERIPLAEAVEAVSLGDAIGGALRGLSYLCRPPQGGDFRTRRLFSFRTPRSAIALDASLTTMPSSSRGSRWSAAAGQPTN